MIWPESLMNAISKIHQIQQQNILIHGVV